MVHWKMSNLYYNVLYYIRGMAENIKTDLFHAVVE